jgi:hypothetical protein
MKRFYVNIYTRKPQWERPTEPIYLPYPTTPYDVQTQTKSLAAQDSDGELFKFQQQIIQQFQMSRQQQQSPPPQNILGRQATAQPNLSQDNALVIDLTKRLMDQASDKKKNELRADLMARIGPQLYQKYISQGQDPLFLYFRNQALPRFRAEKQKRIAQAEQLAMSRQSQPQSQNIPALTPLSKNNATNANALSSPSGIAQLRKSSESLPAPTENSDAMNLDAFIFSDNISAAGLGISPSLELSKKESEKSYVASAIPTKMPKETPQFPVPQSVPVPHHPMQQKGYEPKPFEWPGPGPTLPNRDSMQYQPDLAALQPSSYPRRAPAPEPQAFTSYPLYQDSGMLKLGVQNGEYLYCQYVRHQVLGGLCNELCVDGEQLQTHFEQQHSSFTRIEEPYRAICSFCESLNSYALGACARCLRNNMIQVWVCGNSIRPASY